MARFEVRTQPQTTRTLRSPHLVVDTKTNQIVDEFASKRAAKMDAADRNAAEEN